MLPCQAPHAVSRRGPYGRTSWSVLSKSGVLAIAVCLVPVGMWSVARVGPTLAATGTVDELENGVGVRSGQPLYGTQGIAVPPPNGAGSHGTPHGASGQGVAGAGVVRGGRRDAAAAPELPPLNPYEPLEDEHAAWRKPIAAPGQMAPGVRLLRMRDNLIGIVHTRAYKQTLIRLPPCEEVTLASVGEAEGFTVKVPGLVPKGGVAEAKSLGIPVNEIEVMTKVAASDTSLHVRTRSGRLYAFQVFAERLDVENVSDMTVLVEHDAACQTAGGAATGNAPGGGTGGDFVRNIPFDAARMKFDAYRAFGATPAAAWMAPQHIGFDGLWLFLDYGRRADEITKPIALNVIEGVPSPAQQEWIGPTGSLLVIKSPADTVMLQSGNTWLCIRRVPEDRVPPAVFVVDPALGS